MCANSNANIPMSRDNHERLWQALGVVIAFTVGVCGWYMNRLVDEVDKANSGITSVSVQVARLESQVNGIEKRLDERVSIEPRVSNGEVTASSRLSPFEERSTGVSR